MIFYHTISAFIILACSSLMSQTKQPSEDFDSMKRNLMGVDRQFSQLSETVGVNKAFLFYAAEDAVLLRPNTPPVIGRKTMEEKYFSKLDSGYTLTWEPLYADIAQSGELGNTFGIYEFKTKDETGK